MDWRPAPPPADDEEGIRENLESWDALAHQHAQGSGAEFYRIEQWIAGESKLAPWEIEEMGADRAKVRMALTADGALCATGEGLFVAVKEGHPAFHRWN